MVTRQISEIARNRAVYSSAADGSDLRRHTDHGPYYARHATTDGRRVVFQCAGDLWLLSSLDEQPIRLDIRLGGARSGRSPYPVPGTKYDVDLIARKADVTREARLTLFQRQG